MDILNMDNIFTGDEAASLFEDFQEETAPSAKDNESKGSSEETSNEDPKDKNKETNKATEVDPEHLFDEEEPESVGSEEKKGKEKKDTSSEEETGTSPETNFYSSIASALKEEGVFPDLDDKEVDDIKGPEDFREIFERQIQAGLDEAQRRIYNALNNGVEPNAIKQYEKTLGFLNSIKEEHLNDESDKGVQLRRQLLMQDFMNRKYDTERAAKMTEKLFASGEDIEEAKQALQSNKDFFEDKYNELLEDAKRKNEEERLAAKRYTEQLKKDIMSSDKVFGEIEIDKVTRQKAFENIFKPIYKDPETGEYLTAVQKYKLENESDFIKNVGILFTLTDGFKNLDKLVAPQAKKQVKRKLQELEHVLNNNNKSTDGGSRYIGFGSDNGGKSIFDQGFSIDFN